MIEARRLTWRYCNKLGVGDLRLTVVPQVQAA